MEFKEVSLAELLELGEGTFFYDVRRIGTPAEIYMSLGMRIGGPGQHDAFQYTSVMPWDLPRSDDAPTELRGISDIRLTAKAAEYNRFLIIPDFETVIKLMSDNVAMLRNKYLTPPL